MQAFFHRLVHVRFLLVFSELSHTHASTATHDTTHHTRVNHYTNTQQNDKRESSKLFILFHVRTVFLL